MENKPARWLVPVLIVGGVIWIGRFGIAFLRPEYWDPNTTLDYLAVTGSTLQQWFLALGLLGISRCTPEDSGRGSTLWAMGIQVAILMLVLTGLSNLLEDAAGFKFFGNFWILGVMGSIVGLLLAGAGAFRHPKIPQRMGWFMLAAIAGFQDYGGVVPGITSLILAFVERREISREKEPK